MPDLTTIITSAAVATVITGGVALLGSWRQRNHEREMEKLRDARALRDRKLERNRRGLLVVVEVAFDLLQASNRLFLWPSDSVGEVREVMSKADKKLEPVRAALILDGDTESLLRGVVECSNGYRMLGQATEDLVAPMQHEHIVKAETRKDQLTAWQATRDSAYKVMNEARRTLAEIERPIGDIADIREVPENEYLTTADAEAVEKARAEGVVRG